MKQILAGAINRLGEREKIVLTLYYYEGLTLAQIGEVLGVTESRVCQIHTKAVLQLRSRMLEPERGAGLSPAARRPSRPPTAQATAPALRYDERRPPAHPGAGPFAPRAPPRSPRPAERRGARVTTATDGEAPPWPSSR